MSVKTATAASNMAVEAAARTESFVTQVLETCPGVRRFMDLLLARCGIRCLDIIDHLILCDDAFETAGWARLSDRRWRHPHFSIPDIVLGDRSGFALRVDDVRRFASVAPKFLGDHSILWLDQRIRLFENPDVVVDVVEPGCAHGLRESHSGRVIRRARLHKQLLRTRPRHFRTTEAGIEIAIRMLHAAVADLGSAWASALFLCAEREYWASRCEPAYLRFRRQSQFGVGWSNVDYHSYECSRTHFHQYVKLFEMLGFRRQHMIFEKPSAQLKSERTDGVALTMEHQTLRAIVLLRVDALAGDANEDFGRVRLPPATWHGQSGLWCALHGESILEGGLSHIAARYHTAVVQKLFEQEDIELLTPSSSDVDFALFTKSDRRAVDPRRVQALQQRGYISRVVAEDFRLNGAMASHLAILEREASARKLVCTPETLPAGEPIENRRRCRHRCKRATRSRPATGQQCARTMDEILETQPRK